jgi:hypothetical protein
MKTVLKKTSILETKRHDFDNEFAYIEVWNNNSLKDNYFAVKEDLFLDGSLKPKAKKYFYSPFYGDEIEKEIKPIRLEKFNWFDKLYYFDEDGEIHRIDGVKAEDIEYSLN